MKKKILTVGIPAYNVERYLPECLDSVIDDDLEVLVINDGSQDGTEKTALEYQERFPGIFRVVTKENGGWGSGVNLAIREAKGEYFKNLDSDDTFDKNGLKALLDNMKKYPADIFVSPSLSRDERSGAVYETHIPAGTIFDNVVSSDEMLRSVDSVFWMHSLAFRTELLQSNDIAIDECFYTDMELAAYPLKYARTFFAQREPVYIYRTGRAGQSMSLPSLAKHLSDRERVTNSIVAWYKNGEKSAYCRNMALVSVYSYLTQPFAVTDKSEREKWIEKLRVFKKDVIDGTDGLSDYDRYLPFARMLLKNDFRGYRFLAAVWRFGKTKIAPVYHLLSGR